MQSFAQDRNKSAVREQPHLTSQSGVRSAVNHKAHPLLQLQPMIGNKAVRQLTTQAKLRISQPSDIHEQEADRISEDIMNIPEPSDLNGERLNHLQVMQRLCAGCKGETDCSLNELGVLRIKENPEKILGTGPDLGPIAAGKMSGGQPLSGFLLDFLEPRFGYDFSEVRVHTDSQASETAKALNARAYTFGRDIAFREGEYTPNKKSGQKLLAHELTHVIQQFRNADYVKDSNSINPIKSRPEAEGIISRCDWCGCGQPHAEPFSEDVGTTSPTGPATHESAISESQSRELIIVTLSGRRYQGTRDEIRQFIVSQIGRLRVMIGARHDANTIFYEEELNNPIRWISDLPALIAEQFGVEGRTLPDPFMWERPAMLLNEAMVAYHQNDYQTSLRFIGNAAASYNECATRWYSYIGSSISRAEAICLGLEIFSTVAITVGVTVITAGTATGLTTMGRAFYAAGLSGEATAFRLLAREFGERLVGIDTEINLTQIGEEALISAALSFAGNIVAGWGRNLIVSTFPRYFPDVSSTLAQRYMADLLPRIPFNTLTLSIREAISYFAQGNTRPTTEEFIDKFLEKLAINLGQTAVARILAELARS